MIRSATPVQSIRCGQLFDGERLAEDVLLEIEDGHVTQVRPGAGTAAGADRFGGDGHLQAPFVMPGLIDCHVHCTGYVEGLPAGAPFEPVKAFLRLCIYHGVTAVRDTGNNVETLLYAREWSERYASPRLFGSGPILDVPPLTWPFSRIVRDEAAARRTVDRLADDGVDLIKVYRNVDASLLRPIVSAARDRGLPVAVDCHRTPPHEASQAGVRSLEHLHTLPASVLDYPTHEHGGDMVGWVRAMGDLDPDSPACQRLIDTLREHGTYVVPTVLVARRWALLDEVVNEPKLDLMVAVMPYHRHFRTMRNPIGYAIGRRFMSRYTPMRNLSRTELTAVHRGFARLEDLLVRLHEAGIPIAAGTDTPNPSLVPGSSLHQELQRMAAAGIPPLSVLRSATADAAALLGRSELGRLQPGSAADALLLDTSPLEDVQALSRIQAVVRDGQRIDREEVRSKIDDATERAMAGSAQAS